MLFPRWPAYDEGVPILIDIQLPLHPVRVASIAPFPPEAGAECLFIGRTRGEHHPVHGELRRLVYEAYEPMARDVLRRLAEEAIARHDLRAVRLHHALGPVPTGEASVLVQTAAAHRAEAFAGCRELIDRLKHEAPIWKREEWADGATWSPGQAVAPNEEQR